MQCTARCWRSWKWQRTIIRTEFWAVTMALSCLIGQATIHVGITVACGEEKMAELDLWKKVQTCASRSEDCSRNVWRQIGTLICKRCQSAAHGEKEEEDTTDECNIVGKENGKADQQGRCCCGWRVNCSRHSLHHFAFAKRSVNVDRVRSAFSCAS